MASQPNTNGSTNASDGSSGPGPSSTEASANSSQNPSSDCSHPADSTTQAKHNLPAPVSMEEFDRRMAFFLDMGEQLLLLLRSDLAHAPTPASLRDLQARLRHKLGQNDQQLEVFRGFERRRAWIDRIKAQNVELLAAVNEIEAVLRA